MVSGRFVCRSCGLLGIRGRFESCLLLLPLGRSLPWCGDRLVVISFPIRVLWSSLAGLSSTRRSSMSPALGVCFPLLPSFLTPWSAPLMAVVRGLIVVRLMGRSFPLRFTPSLGLCQLCWGGGPSSVGFPARAASWSLCSRLFIPCVVNDR